MHQSVGGGSGDNRRMLGVIDYIEALQDPDGNLADA